MKLTQTVGRSVLAVILIAGAASYASADEHKKSNPEKSNPGVAKGETSQQQSQQGLGLEGSGSSNVILGGPEIIVGQIEQVQGEEYAVKGDRGQSMKLRLTKDANVICGSGEGAKMSTGRQDAKEGQEIPISPATEGQMKSHDPSKADQQLQALNDPNRQQKEHEMPPPAKDPSQLKDVVGSTDPEANKDVAHGSGFTVGGEGGCQFKAGDRVRIEASDTGTITTIKKLDAHSSESTIAGKGQDQ